MSLEHDPGVPTMHRRGRFLLTMLGAIALCVGTCGITMAVTARSSKTISSTQAVRACATGSGYLRLASSKGDCPTGTSKVSLARPALAPKALSVLSTRAIGSKTSSLSLFGGSTLKATCSRTDDQGFLQARLAIRSGGRARIDGTSFTVTNGDSSAYFQPVGTNQTPELPAGAGSVYETTDGQFAANTFRNYSTINLHLLITVPGAVFTVDSIMEDNDGSGYCRIAAHVESATT